MVCRHDDLMPTVNEDAQPFGDRGNRRRVQVGLRFIDEINNRCRRRTQLKPDRRLLDGGFPTLTYHFGKLSGVRDNTTVGVPDYTIRLPKLKSSKSKRGCHPARDARAYEPQIAPAVSFVEGNTNTTGFLMPVRWRKEVDLDSAKVTYKGRG